MKTRYFLPLAAIVLLAGCNKEVAIEEIPQPEVAKTVLEVSIGQDTKTVMDSENGTGGHKVYWSDGDQIAVNGTASEALENLPDKAQSASFTINGTLDTPYNILYPASIYTAETTVTLPATQAYKAGGFADGMFPMAGYSTDGSNITIKHLCAIVKISVKRATEGTVDTDNIVSVRFEGKAGEQVSGTFSIDYQNATLTGISTAAEDKVVKVVKSQATSTSTAIEYYIVVPARTYASGFDVTVQDANGHIMTMSKSKTWAAEAGKLYVMPEFKFVPTGTELGVEIASAQQLIDFATAYNNKEFGDDLVATVTADITFDATSSAAFNATGGIGMKNGVGSGTEDYYFDGVFNGGNHTISGLEATVPLFVATGSAGTVKDLIVDSSCEFTFTHANTSEGMFASIVGYHKGVLDNVKVAADISLAAVADVAQMTTLGGLAGRTTTGMLQNGCEYSGLITTPAGFTTTEKLIIGGLVGRFTNAGSISDSFFKGAISNEAQVTSTDKANPYLIIGGIVGHADGGSSITSCSTTADHALIEGAYTGTQGHIVNKTLKAYHSVTGGIVGEVNDCTVSSCTNNAAILITIIRNTDDDSLARIIKTGGIVGKNGASGTIDGCTNNGNIQNNSNTRLQAAGGIAGLNAGAIQGDESVNKGNIAFGTTGVDPIYGARIPYIGGIIGENTSSSVSNVRNEGSVELSRTEMSSTGFRIALGGIIGWNSGSLNGGPSKNIVNTGLVYFNTNVNKISAADGYYLGGIVGITSNSVQNAKNAGYINFRWTHATRVVEKAYLGGIAGKMDGDGTFSGCVNEGGTGNAGEVIFNVANGGAHSNNHVGGILGYSDKNVTITDCVNSGNVHTSNYTATDKSMYLGGIVGTLMGASAISGCSNTGVTNLNASNNTDTPAENIFADGGIAGFIKGTASNHISISDCSWNYSEGNVGARRGTCGGIVAYAEYADISDCDVTVVYNMYNHVTGGIVGWAVNSTLSNCKFHGTKITATQGYFSAGIVAKLDSGSIVDGCYNYCKDITAPKAATVIGEIAATSVAGSTIKNCHHTGTIAICSDTNFTDGGGNAADL